VAAADGSMDLAKMSAQDEKNSILALQVQSTLDNAEDAGGGTVQKGSVVDLVLQSLSMNFTATCNTTSKDYLTCANGYVSLDCVFQQAAASFNGVNCIPYLSQCSPQLLNFCRSKVPAADKCKSQTACDCANEAGCGWSRGTMMCLVNRDQVECGDCPSMARCGAIDCSVATRPCDCAALGGQCGWSTSEWRCEAGKDTDCNECAEQTECGGPGLVMANAANCPARVPQQLDSCKQVMSCSFDKKCCPRCGGQKQVCAETRAECDGTTWEVVTAPLVCPDCDDYYYDDSYSADAPSAPLAVNVTQVTPNSAVISWQAPKTNFHSGVDGYSVAYALAANTSSSDKSVKILNTTTATQVTLTGLLGKTEYKVSILPVVTATEAVGTPATLDFTTPAPAVAGKKAKAKAGKFPKAGKSAPKAG